MSKSEGSDEKISFSFKQREKPLPGDVYSFVLRVRFDPSPGGKGLARPVFYLEDVGAGHSKWLAHYDEVIKLLSEWVEAVLDNSKSNQSR